MALFVAELSCLSVAMLIPSAAVIVASVTLTGKIVNA